MENLNYKLLALTENLTVVFNRTADDDFSAFCQNLTARPRFGYGPVEPELDASGHLVALSFGPAVNDDDFGPED